LPGFGARKFASGKVSLFVKYSVGKQPRRKTLGRRWVSGTLPAIRKKAAVVLAHARLGKNVVGEAKRQQEAKQVGANKEPRRPHRAVERAGLGAAPEPRTRRPLCLGGH